MIKSTRDEWEDDIEELESFLVNDAKQLKRVMINSYISGKTNFTLKFPKFSTELYENLKEILKTLPGFEIFHMTPRQIQIKDLSDKNSLKTLDHELCKQRLKSLERIIKSKSK
ncbi:MAG: hypothetical protein ACXQS8_05220 [Candidatus Helarchaeales archaeon]